MELSPVCERPSAYHQFSHGLCPDVDTSAKILLKHIVEVGVSTSPKQLADGLCLVALAPEIENIDEWCKSAIKSLPTEASLIRSGNHNVLNKLVGHAMRASRGRADAHALRKRIQELIC